MRIVPIAEIKQMPPGTAVAATSGVVVEVYPQKSGTGKFGPWTIQKLILADEHHRIEVKLVSVGAFQKDAINHRLYLIAGQGKKGLTGLKTELDTYNGRNELILAVEKQAELTFETPRETTAAAPTPPIPPTPPLPAPPRTHQADPLPGNDDPPETRQAPTTPPPPTPPSSGAKAPAPPTDARKAWLKFDKKILALVRGRVRCECGAQLVKRQLEAMGITVGADHLEKIASWLTIEAGRSGAFADIPDIDPPPMVNPEHH